MLETTMPIVDRKWSGFTLLEVLVVITIIGILVAVGLGSYGTVQAKARDARRKSDLENIARALELYYNDEKQYPPAFNGAISVAPWGGTWNNGGSVIYMQRVPQDTKNGYYYEQTSGGKGYRLYTRLENTEDAAVPRSGTTLQIYQTDPTSYQSSCTYGCNYVIHSTNESLPPTQPDGPP